MEKDNKRDRLLSIAMLIIAIIAAGISAWQAWEAKEARKGAQTAEERMYNLEVSLHAPKLEVRRFTSFSTDLADPRDWQRLQANGVAALKVGTSWKYHDSSENKAYVWVVILNNGNGPSEVLQVESFRYVINGEAKASGSLAFGPKELSLRPGQAICLFLEEIGTWRIEPSGQIVRSLSMLEFETKISVKHAQLIPPKDPVTEELEPPQGWGGELRYPQDVEPDWRL